jgi:hypothetical protein
MKIIRINKLYGENNLVYIEVMYANVSESNENDVLGRPYLNLEKILKKYILGKGAKDVDWRTGTLINNYKEPVIFDAHRVGSYVFELNNLSRDKQYLKKTIQLIFEIK